MTISVGRMAVKAAVLLMAVVVLSAAAVSADERILRFQSDITVHQDSSMTVTETITVRAEGAKIKRGIYRDFPTKYRDGRGNPYHVGFRVVAVARDGSPEPYHTTGLSNGERVYIGEKKTFLRPGEYTYSLTYTTDHQLGFFQDFDEIYWNVTGNGWDFPIDKVSAEIHLPADAGLKIVSSAGYTGPQGAKGDDFTEQRLPSGTIAFATTRPLGRREGLTVAVAWPKGYVVKPPDRAEGPEEPTFPITAGLPYVLACILVLVGYYMIVWSRFGRDPETGVIVVRYEPPSDMSPAVMRFITQMGYDDKTFAAALISCAVKGHIELYDEDGEYRIRKKDGGRVPLAKEEQKALDHLLGRDRDLDLIQRNHAYIRAAVKELTSYLQRTYEKIYFITNRKYFVIGLVLTGILLVASGFGIAYQKGTVPPFLFFCVWLTGWSAGVVMLLRMVYLAWKGVIQGRQKVMKGAGAVFITLFSLPFMGGEVMGMFMLAKFTSLMVVLFLVAAMGLNYLFFHLLKAPTRAGRTVLDAIEGFKRFLAATDKDRMNRMNPLDRTPEVFEKFLPYALALDVEQQWAEQFSDVLARAGAEGYQPSWYHGTSLGAFSAVGFADSLGGAFAGAVASASTAPGSSSGSGGGGSSGGGGGGGGGGGW